MSDGCINCIAAIQQAQSADQQTRKSAENFVLETGKQPRCIVMNTEPSVSSAHEISRIPCHRMYFTVPHQR
jgi:hypothetical protein